MLIVCPQCGFSRNVADDRLKGHYVTAVCPKCACRFKIFSDGHVSILGDARNEGNAEEDKRMAAARAYEREQKRLEEESSLKDEVGDIDYVDDDMEYEPPTGIPWDDAPGTFGWFISFQVTVITVLVSPANFFRRLDPEQPVYKALLFFLIICVFQIVVERLWIEAFLHFFSSATINDPQMKTFLELLTPKTNIILTILLRAAISVLQLYIFSFLMSLAMRLVEPDMAGFSLIFQILAYSAAPSLFCIVPALGSLIGSIWGICCVAIGLRAACELEWPKVFFVFLPPLLLILPLLSQTLNLLGR